MIYIDRKKPAAKLGLNQWVHVLAYAGERRDDYGETIGFRNGQEGEAQVLVKLFAVEGEGHRWRWFRLDRIMFEPPAK